MGISYEEFWTLNPRKINALFEGYKLRRKIEDEKSWLLGGYMFHAVSVSLGNAFRKKNQKAESYFEALDAPFLSKVEETEMSESEKQKRLDALMAGLHIMQGNFEIKHGK